MLKLTLRSVAALVMLLLTASQVVAQRADWVPPWFNYKAGPTGGSGGTEFSEQASTNERICGLVIREYRRVDAVQLKICDISTGAMRYSGHFGGYGGEAREIDFAKDEVITGLDVCSKYFRYNRRVFGLDVFTNKNTYTSTRHGSAKSKCTKTFTTQLPQAQIPKDVGLASYRAPQGFAIQGLHGRSGNELDALGVTYRSTELNNEVEYSHGGTYPQGIIGHGYTVDDYRLYISSSGDWTTVLLRGIDDRPRGGRALIDQGFIDQGRLCGFTVKHYTLIDSLHAKQCDEVDNSLLDDFLQNNVLGHGWGSRSDFDLDPGEDITEIRVWYDHWVIRGLQFVSTQKTSPIYGTTQGVQGVFQILPGHEIKRVDGRYYHQLRSLEIYTAEKDS